MAITTYLAISKLKSESKTTKHSIGNGLYIFVLPDGKKNWMIRYSVNNVQRDYRPARLFGPNTNDAYLSLSDAKLLAATVRALAKQGVCYQAKLASDAIKPVIASESLTVNDLYGAWFATLRRKDNGDSLARSFNRDILPTLGSLKLIDLEESHISTLLKPIWLRGNNRTSIVMLNSLKQMFKWAEGRRPWKLSIDNPVVNLQDENVTELGYKETERDRVLSDDEILKLYRAMTPALLPKTTEAVIWITLSCCTRVGETVKTKWQHLDLENGVWTIPAENTKTLTKHTVYLSTFAIEQFKILQTHTGDGEWCFPNRVKTSHLCPKAPTKQLMDRQRVTPLKNRTGFPTTLLLGDSKWTVHDLRRTGATLLQHLKVEPHLIERILNHAEQNKMAKIYQQYDYKVELRAAWQLLGNHLKVVTLTIDR